MSSVNFERVEVEAMTAAMFENFDLRHDEDEFLPDISGRRESVTCSWYESGLCQGCSMWFSADESK